MAVELGYKPVVREYSDEPAKDRDSRSRIHNYADVLETAFRKAKPPLFLDRDRPFRRASNRRVRVETHSYGSTPVMSYGDTVISVGYRDPWINKGVIVLKNEPNPKYGMRVGPKDEVAHTHRQISDQLNKLVKEHHIDPKDVIAPVLFELARQQGRVPFEAIHRAASPEINAITVINSLVQNGTVRERKIYLTDPESNKVICVTSSVPSDMNSYLLADVEYVQALLAEQEIQERLATVPDQAANILMDETRVPIIIGERDNAGKKRIKREPLLKAAKHARSDMRSTFYISLFPLIPLISFVDDPKGVKDDYASQVSWKKYENAKVKLLKTIGTVPQDAPETREALLESFLVSQTASALEYKGFVTRNGIVTDVIGLVTALRASEALEMPENAIDTLAPLFIEACLEAGLAFKFAMGDEYKSFSGKQKEAAFQTAVIKQKIVASEFLPRIIDELGADVSRDALAPWLTSAISQTVAVHEATWKQMHKPSVPAPETATVPAFEPEEGEVFTLADLGKDSEHYMNNHEYNMLLRAAIESAQLQASARGEKASVDYTKVKLEFPLTKLSDGRIVPLLFVHKNNIA